MDWLSLCVCGTKLDSNDRKIEKDGKRKKSKKSKKNPKQKGSRKPPPFIVDEFLRKSQDEQPKEIAENERTNGEIVNYLNECAKNQIGSTDQTDPSKVNGSPSYQIGSDYERSFEKCFKNSERNASESARKPCDIDYHDNVMLHSRCASSTADENEKQVKRISDEGEHNEEELDESIPRSGELEDLSWTSEIEDRRDTESNFDRELGERISSRINFAKEEQGKSRAKASLKKKGARNILPPIKGLSRAEARMDNEELQAHGETNKFGFKKSAAFHERLEARRKLNSCSFEVRPFEDEERSGKTTRTRGEGSMIPRLASPPRQGINSIKNDSDKSEIVQNGRVHSAVVSGINLEQRTVTVEWFERGETKGKEVEIDAILALNRDLNQKMGPRTEICALPQVMNNHMLASSRARHSTRPSIPVKAGSNRQLSRPTGRPTNIMSSTTSVNGHGESVSGLTGRRELENIPPMPTAAVTQCLMTPVQNRQQKQAQQQQQQQQQLQQQQQQQQQAQIENGRGRRSNVVKEVERLKKNREERRQRQAELKEEKEALMNLDPGNPNWEFLAMIREYQNSIEFRPLRETDPVENHQITVCVRKRPLNKKEHTRKEIDVISVPSKDQMVVHEPKSKVDLTKYLENQIFRFDYAFDETCNNEIVYKYTAKPLVQTIFEGGMATCFAYGQTGSGKTHTMGGDFNGKTQDCKKGIYAMVAKDVFKCLKLAKYRPLNLVISASFFEIYSGKVFDLLADKEKLRVLEDGKQQVQIVGLTEKVVETCDEVLKLIQHGNSARTSGQTSANSNSSRSHAVFQIIARIPGTHKVHGKFSLIDLAGNERGADTSSANRQTRMEGAEINKSLLALKECIRALSRKGTHLPFRASKLTQVLRDSFIGEKSKTCMIAMISPGMSSCEHSLNTLRYADRVKELAATDPTEIKASPTDDDRGMKIEEQGNNSVLSDSDLAQLRSLNEGELSQDLYTFHEAVSALQMLEEEVLDTHKLVMDNTTKFLNDAHSVFSATHEVDYDQEDTRSKTKANSIITLNRHRRGSSSTNVTIMINDDTDSDTQTLNTTEVDTIAKNSLMSSPWKDEMEFRSDFNSNDTEEDSGVQRSNQSQLVKVSTNDKKKSQRYHWSGTFRTKTSPKGTSCSTYYSPRKEKSHAISSLTNYNYYCEDFVKKKFASKGDIFYPNKFDPQAVDDSWQDWIGCQPCTDICTDNFERRNNFKDYDTDQDNSALPAVFSDVNINLRRRKMTDVGNKNENTYDVDSQTNNSLILYSQLAHDIDNVNKEDNLCNAKEFIDPSINIKSNIRKMINYPEEKSAIQLDCYKILYSLLSFLKNVILFSLLPTAYIIFFIYVQEREDKKQGNI
ncbi:kinesin-like protein 10A isoform X4 [Temnothorax americanus]|uniref:kinesin-like protein 10A isoform X4 n=1 Tax=Temnothorax americanus TaxID=1964332 RepID=UPI004067DCD0